MSARSKIINALVTKLKLINGETVYTANIFNNVFNKLKFWDEVNDYPSMFLNAGPETREYLPAGFKWGYLTVTIRVYVKAEEPETELEKFFTDVEYIVDNNGELLFDEVTGDKTEDIKIMSIHTDEGLLAPVGVGEITLQIMYEL